MEHKVGSLPIIEIQNNDQNMFYAVGSLATLAFLNSVLDDGGSLAGFIPDDFSPQTLADSKEWIQVSKQSMVDYFTQFAGKTEAMDLLDMAVASVALPTVYNKSVDTFAEIKQSNKKEDNKFMKLIPKPPVNFTSEVRSEIEDSIKFPTDFGGPNGSFLPMPY